jgi:hypothetical protein
MGGYMPRGSSIAFVALSTFSAIIALLATASAAAGTAATVTATSVTETRNRQIAKDDNNGTFFSSSPGGLVLSLHVAGGAAENAKSVGFLKFTEAVDDAGTSLVPDKHAFTGFGVPSDEFKPISHNGFDSDEKAKSHGFDAELHLGCSARKATKIKSLKGEFQILGGRKDSVVSISKPKDHFGKPLTNPELKTTRVTITLAADSSAADDPQKLRVEIKGDSGGEIQKIEITDAAGKKISDESFTMSMGDEKTTHFTLTKPVDAAVVKIHLNIGQEKQTVPFDLHDIALP